MPETSNIKSTSVKLNWDEPETDGGSAISNYILEMRKDGDFKWKQVTEEIIINREFTVRGLKENEKYEFRVAAENLAGVGSHSNISDLILIKEKISKL